MVSRLQRFDSHVGVNLDSDCWLWAGATLPHGYGQFRDGDKVWKAHRWSYTYAKGPIPNGLQLDHLCRVRNCVNPDHLEPVTAKENSMRGDTGKNNADKTHCPHGHLYSGDNLYIRPDKARACNICKRKATATWRNKLRRD